MHHKFVMVCQAKEGIELLYEADIFANRTSSISQWNFLMLPYYSRTKLLGRYRSDIKNSNESPNYSSSISVYAFH